MDANDAATQITEYGLVCQCSQGTGGPRTCRLEEGRQAKRVQCEDQVEFELIVAGTSLGRYAEIHPTKFMSGEKLSKDMSCSCTGFLLNKKAMVVHVDGTRVQNKMDFLSKCMTIAYFVGGCKPRKPYKSG